MLHLYNLDYLLFNDPDLILHTIKKKKEGNVQNKASPWSNYIAKHYKPFTCS